MPPTIHNNKAPAPEREARQSRTTERRPELVCRIRYCNTLPDIPFDPKFIQYPFDATRFISYKPTTLERNYKYEVLTEHDLGVTIDLIDKDAYTPQFGAVLDPADEKLLEEDIMTPQDSVRSRHHARSVSWLRRTEYISTEQTRFQPQTMDKVEAKVGFSIKKNLKEDPLIMDRDMQIKAIEKTFEDSLKPIEKHYSKPNVYPVEILPIYPDFDCWKYPCAQVIFDSDPAPVGRSVPAQIEEMSQAMIRGVMDESGEQFVAYFLPTEETLVKRRNDLSNNMAYEDDQEYEYKMAREYNWNVKNKASKGYEENYFLVVREGGMYYNELETRVRLSKRRQKPGQAPSNTRLVIKHRPINELEYKMQRYRERQLEQPNEEDEEEEPEVAPEQVTITRTGEKPKASNDDDEKGSGTEKEESDNESEKDDDKTPKNKSDEEGGSGSENETKRSRSHSRSRSRSSSAGTKATKTTRRSRSGSGSRSRSRSGSKSASGSDHETKRSKSPSQARSRSRSSSAESKKSEGTRKSRSRSRSNSGSRSHSGSRSGSGSDNETKKSRSRSPSGSRSSSAESKSTKATTRKSRSRSRSGTPIRSASESGSGDASD